VRPVRSPRFHFIGYAFFTWGWLVGAIGRLLVWIGQERRTECVDIAREWTGLLGMIAGAEIFSELVSAVLRRFVLQNGGREPHPAVLVSLSARLWALVLERGLPPPLLAGELGTPGGMSEEACALLAARVLAESADKELALGVTQLIKACFYPEFMVCRDSFRALAVAGGCRRQELTRVRARVSGSHCVDCPYWVALSPERHEEFLQESWLADRGELRDHGTIFLPEDFRALRKWLQAAKRTSTALAPQKKMRSSERSSRA